MNNEDQKSKLNRLGSHITGTPKSPSKNHSVHYRQLAKAVGGKLVEHCGGTICIVSENFGPGFLHGIRTLETREVDDVVSLAAFAPYFDEQDIGFDRLLFFDTETTGLGGSGAVAFLVGVGSISESGFEVRQYLIPDYGDETAMLELLLEEFTPDKCLVSFNGASFDLPLLEGRMIINRVVRKVEYVHHIDLLHASRRLFRRRLQDCTLVNLERQLFGFERVDDIPGYLIPTVYFNWVQDRRTEDLCSVMLHNRLDILSLYFLLQLLEDAYRTLGESLDSTTDLYSLSRFLTRQKRIAAAESVSIRIEQESALTDDEIRFHNSLVFKRSGRLDQALEIWGKLSDSDSKQGCLACLELAKFMEHSRRDYNQALESALAAKSRSEKGSRLEADLIHRIERLRRKIDL